LYYLPVPNRFERIEVGVMLTVQPSAAGWTKTVVASITMLMETRPYGIRVAGPKHEIAGSVTFRLIETALRGITRFPDTMERIDVEVVMQHIPHVRPQSRHEAKKLLTAIIREEINKKRIVAVEVRSPRHVLRQHMAEYWIMTPGQWETLQRADHQQLGVATYRRALTSS